MACDTPFYVQNPVFPDKSPQRYVPVPCGKCPDCLHRRSAAWCFRMLQQDRVSDSSYFVTLTYDSDHVPITDNGFMSLKRSDVQAFFKRLRYAQNGSAKSPIKYYLAGEYGDMYQRPHYHIILFNADYKLISPAWGFGKVTVDPVNGKTVAYTTKYINKGKLIPVHSRDDRAPEFSLMSKGLGKNYMSPDILKYHQADINRNYVIQEGFKVAMPRYYREKIFTEQQRELQSLTHERKFDQLERSKEQQYKERTGSMDGYDKSRYEAKKAAILNFKNKIKNRKSF